MNEHNNLDGYKMDMDRNLGGINTVCFWWLCSFSCVFVFCKL